MYRLYIYIYIQKQIIAINNKMYQKKVLMKLIRR